MVSKALQARPNCTSAKILLFFFIFFVFLQCIESHIQTHSKHVAQYQPLQTINKNKIKNKQTTNAPLIQTQCNDTKIMANKIKKFKKKYLLFVLFYRLTVLSITFIALSCLLSPKNTNVDMHLR